MAMKILITGATGLVGKVLTASLRDQGHTVHYLTTSKTKIVQEPNYLGYLWNPAAGQIDEAAFEGVEIIIHLAGATIAQRWTAANKQSIKASRIQSAQLMYEVLERFRESKKSTTLKHIISASAIGCYPSSDTALYYENYEGYATGFLGEVVQEWEEAVYRFQELGVKTTVVRTGIILDKSSGALEKIIQPIKKYVGAPLGSGTQWQSWIHIKDMARLYMHIVDQQLEGAYNGVAPHPVTNTQLTKEAARVLKKPLFLPKVPAFVLKLLLGDMSEIVLQSQQVSAQKIKQTGFVFKYPTINKALQDLLA